MEVLNVTSLSDEALVFKIAATNDTNLYAVLYDRFSSLVYNKCYGFSTNKQEAEDLTHDVFVRLFLKLDTFKGKSKFSTWLYSFTYNFCVNYVNRDLHKKNQKNMVVREEIKEVNEYDEIDDNSLFELKASKLAKALNAIDLSDKNILLMKYQDDLTIKEIQQVIGIGESAVKMRLKRAKEKLILIYQEL